MSRIRGQIDKRRTGIFFFFLFICIQQSYFGLSIFVKPRLSQTSGRSRQPLFSGKPSVGRPTSPPYSGNLYLYINIYMIKENPSRAKHGLALYESLYFPTSIPTPFFIIFFFPRPPRAPPRESSVSAARLYIILYTYTYIFIYTYFKRLHRHSDVPYVYGRRIPFWF